MSELAFVGLGLWDEQDVSFRGAQSIRDADTVFIETYTAFLGGTSLATLEAFHGRAFRHLSRSDVEKGDVVLEAARDGRAVLVVPGDSMTATTHVELRARAARAGIPTRLVHGASIATAASALLGLAHYKFGRSTTIVFPEGSYFPTSPYDVVRENLERGLHTLCLLDLRAGGSETENRPGTAVEGPRYMTASEGAALLLRMEAERKEGALTEATTACVVARAGSPAPIVARGPLAALARADFGAPLHVLVVPGKLHFSEEDALAALAAQFL